MLAFPITAEATAERRARRRVAKARPPSRETPAELVRDAPTGQAEAGAGGRRGAAAASGGAARLLSSISVPQ